METESAQIASRFQQICEQIRIHAIKANRNPEEIKLVVVTKGQSIEKIRAVVAAGAKFLGENYPEETGSKFDESFRAENLGFQIHLIGHLQSRKISLVLGRFDCFHALDSRELAEKMNHRISLGKFNPLPVLLQYNVSGENEKYGWMAADEKKWPDLCTDFEKILELKNLSLAGLMTMPPFVEKPESSRIFFERLRRLKEFFVTRYPGCGLKELSMGTSQDFEAAISEGATYLRIGNAIMGERTLQMK
jgi:pyridoxal phosphate enzyme (YggS family)